jgi:hypothetical protein
MGEEQHIAVMRSEPKTTHPSPQLDTASTKASLLYARRDKY